MELLQPTLHHEDYLSCSPAGRKNYYHPRQSCAHKAFQIHLNTIFCNMHEVLNQVVKQWPLALICSSTRGQHWAEGNKEDTCRTQAINPIVCHLTINMTFEKVRWLSGWSNLLIVTAWRCILHKCLNVICDEWHLFLVADRKYRRATNHGTPHMVEVRNCRNTSCENLRKERKAVCKSW